MCSKDMDDSWDFCDSPSSSVLEEELTESEHICITCKTMLEFLNKSHLEVVVNDHIRITINNNTQWYQDFCAEYTNSSWIYKNGKRHDAKNENELS